MTEQPPVDADAQHDPFAGPAWGEREAASVSPDGTERRRRRVRVPVRRRRRRGRIVLIVVGGALVLAAAWLVVTGLMARSQITSARADVHQLRAEIAAGDLAAARATAANFAKHAHRAHLLTTGPAWTVAAQLPLGGEPLHTLRGMTSSIDQLGSDALPQLMRASVVLDPSTLRRPDGSFDLARIASAAPALDRASAAMSAVSGSIAHLPHSTWLGSVDSARRDILTQMSVLGRDVRSAGLAARIAPPMLGQGGTKRYIVAFQNDAEARGTGGLSGAFAIMQARYGKVRFTQFESDSALRGVPANVDFGAAYNQLFHGAGTTTLASNANLSPHFPYAAQTWSSMWQKRTGEQVDGAIAIDPTALRYLLAVTGPVTLADKTPISAGNVVSFTQSTLYARFANDTTARRDYLLNVANAVAKTLVDTHSDTTALARAAGRAVGERRLLVWSADPAVQANIAQTSLAGIIPTTAAPYVGLSIVNDGGNKLDYYLDRTLNWSRAGCGSTRAVTVAITLKNSAPAHGLSDYVTHRSDHHSYPIKPGDNRLEVSYYATHGASMSNVTVNGKVGTASVGSDHGHPVYTVDLELPRGTSRTIVLHLIEPAGTGSPVVLRQPLVRPLHVSLDDPRCH